MSIEDLSQITARVGGVVCMCLSVRRWGGTEVLVVLAVTTVSIVGSHFFTYRAQYLKHTSPMFVHSICGTTSET